MMAMYECKFCGIEFRSIHSSGYCSDECRHRARLLRATKCRRKNKGDNHRKWARKGDTLCWFCAKAGGKDSECPWASRLKPVPGWKVQAGEAYTDSYKIKECPLFKEG